MRFIVIIIKKGVFAFQVDPFEKKVEDFLIVLVPKCSLFAAYGFWNLYPLVVGSERSGCVQERRAKGTSHNVPLLAR